MVSTRGVKVKFSEGERVLCYEPDPSKAKVLYDSKVLEIVHTSDSRGRKQVEYLIHFQGWNASWDRCVTEDFVLKDTEENRALQRDLAEKSHIKLSIKSNRVLVGPTSSEKERRRRRHTGPDANQDRDQEGSTSSLEEGSSEDEMTSAVSDAENSAHDGEGTEDEPEETTLEERIARHVPLVLPDALKAVLERDYHLVNEQNKLVNLPAEHSVLDILEQYVHHFAAMYAASAREKRRPEVKEKDKSVLTLDLCKEVVDGVRICFDFHVESLLLYNKEKDQAKRLKRAAPFSPEKKKTTEENLESKSNSVTHRGTETASPTKSAREERRLVDATPRRVLRSKKSALEDIPTAESKEAPRTSIAIADECGRSTPSVGNGTASVSSEDWNLCPAALHQALQRQLDGWTLVPPSFRHPPPPVMIYGSVHLLRLFVKMPEILYHMSLSAEKRRVILRHLDLLLEYLNASNQELFSDANYVVNPDAT